MLSVNIIKNNLRNFLAELEEVCRCCGRKREDIKVVYATKYLNPEQFVSFIDMAREFETDPVLIGENRVQEAETKFSYLRGSCRSRIPHDDTSSFWEPSLASPASLNISLDVKFVMIGTLQKNKINRAIEIFEEIHSVDSLELAYAINMRLEKRVMPIFLEVNVSGEKSKHGITPAMIDGIVKPLKSLRSLKLRGLMTMAPHFEDPKDARPIFRSLRQLADRYQLLTSMGMSNDWKVAVEEGADYIRVGGRIFRSENWRY